MSYILHRAPVYKKNLIIKGPKEPGKHLKRYQALFFKNLNVSDSPQPSLLARITLVARSCTSFSDTSGKEVQVLLFPHSLPEDSVDFYCEGEQRNSVCSKKLDSG